MLSLFGIVIHFLITRAYIDIVTLCYAYPPQWHHLDGMS